MKHQRGFGAQQSTDAQSCLSKPESFTQEKNAAFAGRGQTMPSFRDAAFPTKAQTLETVWSPEAEVILPEQFFCSGDESHAAWTGERRLLFAVLEEAVDSFLRYRTATTRRGKRLFHETVEWFWSEDESWLYSFAIICRHLDLDAEYIRGGLQRLSDMEPEKRTNASSPRGGRKSRQTNPMLARAA